MQGNPKDKRKTRSAETQKHLKESKHMGATSLLKKPDSNR